MADRPTFAELRAIPDHERPWRYRRTLFLDSGWEIACWTYTHPVAAAPLHAAFAIVFSASLYLKGVVHGFSWFAIALGALVFTASYVGALRDVTRFVRRRTRTPPAG